MPKKRKNVIDLYSSSETIGEAENFEPEMLPLDSPEWSPTKEPAGSDSKIETLRHRVENGLPLWHPNDNKLVLHQTPLYDLKIQRLLKTRILKNEVDD